jgi:antitoxin CptB
MPAMTDHRSEEIAVRRKRLVFRAQRRGFREVDLIFGAFAAGPLHELNSGELDQFERLLDAPDQAVYAWLQEFEPVPEEFDTPVFARLKALCRRTDPTWNV